MLVGSAYLQTQGTELWLLKCRNEMPKNCSYTLICIRILGSMQMKKTHFAPCDDKLVFLSVICHGAAVQLTTNLIESDLTNKTNLELPPPSVGVCSHLLVRVTNSDGVHSSNGGYHEICPRAKLPES